MSNSIKDIWIAQTKLSERKVIKQSIKEVTNINCFIGTILVSKAKFFSIEILPKVPIDANYLKRFVGVEVQILQVKGGKKELTIILLEEELTDIFILFIEDIIKSLLSLKDPQGILSIISNRINYWKKLFGKLSNKLLTQQQQRGLFGELFFVKKLIKSNSANIKKIIEAWQAPKGTNQDFYFNRKAIEVKTSKSNNPSIKISNEFQLDTTGLDRLYIAFFKLNIYPDNENTLLKLIIEIRKLLVSDSKILNNFNSKLEYIGIAPLLEDEYNKISYSIQSEKYYHITKNFPKITPLMIDDAISKVGYEIAPKHCSAFEIDFESVLKDILHG